MGVVERILVVQQIAQPILPKPCVGIAWRTRLRQCCHQCFVCHVIHHRARGVIRAGLLAGGVAGFGVVRGEEILEHLAEQFGI